MIIVNDYSIKQKLSSKAQPRNLQPFYVWFIFSCLWIISLLMIHFSINRFMTGKPHIFYGLLIVYMTMIRFYSKATESPSYAVDEDDVEKVGEEAKIDTKRFYYRHCKIYVPIRASHCSTCMKCILR